MDPPATAFIYQMRPRPTTSAVSTTAVADVHSAAHVARYAPIDGDIDAPPWPAAGAGTHMNVLEAQQPTPQPQRIQLPPVAAAAPAAAHPQLMADLRPRAVEILIPVDVMGPGPHVIVPHPSQSFLPRPEAAAPSQRPPPKRASADPWPAAAGTAVPLAPAPSNSAKAPSSPHGQLQNLWARLRGQSASGSRRNEDVAQEYKNLRTLIDTQFLHVKLNIRRADAYVKVLKVNREAIAIYKELSLYLIFSTLFFWLVVNVLPLNVNTQQDSALIAPGGFLNYVQLGSDQTAYLAMNTVEQFYDYVRNILLPLLNVDGTSSFQWTRKRIGAIRLRQVRVRGFTCPAVDPKTMLSIQSATCYAEYYSSVDDTRFAPSANRTSWSTMLAQLRPSEKYLRDGSPFWSYGTTGFFVDLPTSLADADATIQALIDNRWIDEATRAVVASFTLQNPQTTTYTVADMVVEIPNSGILLPSIDLNTLKLQPLDSGPVLAVGIVFMLFVLLFIVIEFKEMLDVGVFAYVRALWNLWDIVHVTLIIWLYARVGEYVRFSRDMTFELSAKPDPARFYDFSRGANMMRDIQQIAGIAILVTFLRMFKFFELNTYLSVLTNTLWKAIPELSAILLIFFVLFCGYAFMAWVMFGYKVNEFRSFHASFSTLFGNIGGGFPYDDLADAAPGGAVVFFFSFIVVISLVLVNIFIAIVNKYYVKAEETAIERGYVVDDETMKELDEEARLGIFSKFRSISRSVKISLDDRPEEGGNPSQRVDRDSQVPRLRRLARDSIVRVRLSTTLAASGPHPDARQQEKRSGSVHPSEQFYDVEAVAHGKEMWKRFLREVLDRGDTLTLNFTSSLMQASCPLRVFRFSNSTDGFYIDCFVTSDGTIVNGAALVLPFWTFVKRLVFMYVRNLSSGRTRGRARRLFAESGITVPTAILKDEDMEDQIMAIAKTNLDLRKKGEDGKQRRVYGLEEMARAVRRVKAAARAKAVKWMNEAFVGLLLSEAIRVDSLHKELVELPRRALRESDGEPALFARLARLDEELVEASESFYRWVDELHMNIAGGKAIMVVDGLRFDEVCDLIRDTLIQSGRTGFNEIDIKKEAIRFLSGFPNSCFDTVDDVSRERGKVYVPRPYDTKQIEGTERDPAKFLSPKIKETLGMVVHDIWALSKLKAGWKYGPRRDNASKLHNLLKPITELSDGDARNDIDTAVQTLRAVVVFGYDLVFVSGGSAEMSVPQIESRLVKMPGQEDFQDSGALSPGYSLREVDLSNVRETEDVKELIELLAKNVHDVWAQDLKTKGWTYGETNDRKKQHSLLVPYALLTEEEKKSDRDNVRTTIMSIMGLGWRIEPRKINRAM